MIQFDNLYFYILNLKKCKCDKNSIGIFIRGKQIKTTKKLYHKFIIDCNYAKRAVRFR